MIFRRRNPIEKWGLLFLLSSSLVVTSLSGGSANGKGRAENSRQAQQKELVDAAFDRICIEISKEYLISKGMAFPNKIKSIEALEDFLRRVYADEGHELRQLVLKLRLYRDRFVDADTSLGDYLKKGVETYAVDLNGRTLNYDKEKIAGIIREATAKANQPEADKNENKDNEELVVTNPSTGALDLVAAFIMQHSLLLVGVLGGTNLTLLAVVIWMWRRRPPKLALGDPQLGEHREKRRIVTINADSITPDDEPARLQESHDINLSSTATATATPTAIESPDELSPVNGNDHGNWLVVKTSVPGRLHTQSTPAIPCQDSCAYEYLGNGWGIAVVCDGAGSKMFSHHGSKFVAEKSGTYFREVVETNGWAPHGELPLQGQWHELARSVFERIAVELAEFAEDKFHVDSHLLGCTVIVMIHTPLGVLASHVGDGRAAFCTFENEWKAVIKPHKGEEANQTVFITAINGEQPDDYIESTVFPERPLAFTLMSDGCESHSFEVNIFDEGEKRYKDPNRPYSKFFQPLMSTLRNLHQTQTAKEEIDRKWQLFIEAGSERLKNEPDDKTMILGILV